MLIQVDNEPAVAETEKEKPHPAVKKTSTIAEKAAKYSEAKLKRRSDEGKKDSKVEWSDLAMYFSDQIWESLYLYFCHFLPKGRNQGRR